MCGRLTITKYSIDDLVFALDAEIRAGDEELFRPRYNVAPTNTHWLLRLVGGRRQIMPATWGFSARGTTLINARIETAASKPTFRQAFRSRRCVIPADGFIEWSGASKQRRPFWFRPADEGLLLLAGIFDQPTANDVPRFVVLTTAANETISKIHDRMPVILTPEDIPRWLDGTLPGPPREFANDALTVTAVSTRVNSAVNDDPECLAPPPQEPLPKQLKFFS